MRTAITIACLFLVVGCHSHDFRSLSDIQTQLGPEYPVPSLADIYGKQGFTALWEAEGGSICRLRPLLDETEFDEAFCLGMFRIDGNGIPLRSDELERLLGGLRDWDNYGDRTLGVFKADFGFRLIAQPISLHILFDRETGQITVATRPNPVGNTRLASPQLIRIADAIARRHGIRKI